ncbi:MAG: hypothetical protein HY909_12275 [Deltaproteobacteria bacterium]|nr:hypothetical protein [Deltaproteobacteria bacterium]
MTIAFQSQRAAEILQVAGRRYRWQEGASARHPRVFRGRREEARRAFYRAYLPVLVARGATRRELPAGRRGVLQDSLWVTWTPRDHHAAGVVWSLWVPSRGSRVPVVVAGGAEPANEGMVLAAWGDGPVLAWCSQSPALRALTREALRALPEFLAQGVVSGDETLALKIEPCEAHG